MKVYVSYKTHKEYLNRHLPKSIELVEDAQQADVLITGSLAPDAAPPRLRAVIIPFTAHNKIHLPTLRRQNIALFNTTAHSIYVAEKALQLLLASLGGVINKHADLADGVWRTRFEPWTSLRNKHVGIYGYGRIGRAFHELIKPFAPTVHVIDRGKDYPGCRPLQDFDALIDASDILLIAAPLTASTRGAFDAGRLMRMQGKYLVNVGRGPIIDEDALYEAIHSGVLAGYAGDVWYQYPSSPEGYAHPSKHPFEAFDNVILSPHSGAHADLGRKAMLEEVYRHVMAVHAGDYSEALDLDRLE